MVPAEGESRTDPGGHLLVDGATVNCATALEIAIDNFSTDVMTVKDGSTITAGEVDVGDGGTGTLVMGGDFSGRFGTPDDSGLVSTLTAATINIGGGQFDAGGVQSAMYVINGSLVSSQNATIGGVDGFVDVSGITAGECGSTWNARNITVETGDLGGGLAVMEGGLVTSATTIIDDGNAVVDGASGVTPSTWTITGILYVGSTTGPQQYTLEVTDGATPAIGGCVFWGWDAFERGWGRR